MKLEIENSYQDSDLKDFIYDMVIPTAKQLLWAILDQKHLIRFTEYFSRINNTYINAKDILILGINSFIIKKYPGKYILEIDPNIFISKAKAKLYDLCALINYGNLDLGPYNIFDQIMVRLADMLPELYLKYYYGGIV